MKRIPGESPVVEPPRCGAAIVRDAMTDERRSKNRHLQGIPPEHCAFIGFVGVACSSYVRAGGVTAVVENARRLLACVADVEKAAACEGLISAPLIDSLELPPQAASA